MGLYLKKLDAGVSLPRLERRVTQEHINLYASASGDFNPIHIDPEFARKTPAGGTIAHGMLILAYVSEFMTNSFEMDWLTGGNLSARFKVPARPGDIITVSGEITGIQKEDGATCIYCDVFCQNQRGEAVIIGETKVKVKNDENSH
jgi:3-hydroxybutyryl-CoA dehydratase